MCLVPGGQIAVGWDGAPVNLTPARREHWSEHAEFDGSFEDLLGTFFAPQRIVTVPPLLVERTPVSVGHLGVDCGTRELEDAVRSTVHATGFVLLTHDSWENAARAGVTTLFPWGDEWPEGVPHKGSTTFTRHELPNALGLQLLADPYNVEIVAERDAVRGGDGGTALCGGRPPPEPWYTFAFAFRHPRSLWDDVVGEMFERAYVRRALRVTAAFVG
jgi:hypothetical protein